MESLMFGCVAEMKVQWYGLLQGRELLPTGKGSW